MRFNPILFYEYGKNRNLLISYYKLDNNLLDSIGLNDGSNINGVTYGLGKIGNAAFFNGSNSYVEIGNPDNLKLRRGTISCWIKANGATNTAHRAIFGKSNAYMIFLYDSILEVYDWGSSGRITTGISLADNLWHHIVFVFDSGTPYNYLYLDGILVKTTYITITDQTNSVRIGWNWSTQYFNGYIDEASIYNYKLTDVEVSELYNSGNGITV
jgi:hypothetical protein